MGQETVTISRKEYEALLEGLGILRNKEMMEAVKESDQAKSKGNCHCLQLVIKRRLFLSEKKF